MSTNAKLSILVLLAIGGFIFSFIRISSANAEIQSLIMKVDSLQDWQKARPCEDMMKANMVEPYHQQQNMEHPVPLPS